MTETDLERAFSYLIDQATPHLCRCFPHGAKIGVHADECPIAIAIDGSTGARPLPSRCDEEDPP